MVPPVTSSSPATQRKVVDFPHPDGPTKTTNSRSATSRLKSWTALCPPVYVFSTFFRTTRAMVGSLSPPHRGRKRDHVLVGMNGGIVSRWIPVADLHPRPVEPVRVLEHDLVMRLPPAPEDQPRGHDGEALRTVARIGLHAVEPQRRGEPRQHAVPDLHAVFLLGDVVVVGVWRAGDAREHTKEADDNVRRLAVETIRVPEQLADAEVVLAGQREEIAVAAAVRTEVARHEPWSARRIEHLHDAADRERIDRVGLPRHEIQVAEVVHR